MRIDRYETSNSTDPSERDLDDFSFDMYLSNKGSLLELEVLVDSLVGGL